MSSSELLGDQEHKREEEGEQNGSPKGQRLEVGVGADVFGEVRVIPGLRAPTLVLAVVHGRHGDLQALKQENEGGAPAFLTDSALTEPSSSRPISFGGPEDSPMFGDKIGIVLFLWIVGAPLTLALLTQVGMRR